MSEADLKRAEAWALLVHEGCEPGKFAVFATVHDLTAEVRRWQERYREAVNTLAGVATNLKLDPSALCEDPSVVLNESNRLRDRVEALEKALRDLLELNDARSKRLFDDETWGPARSVLEGRET